MKSLLAALICLALLASPALAEVFPVSYSPSDDREDCAMLLRDDGTPLTPADTYQSIYAITPDGTPEAERLYCAVPTKLPDLPDAASYEDLDFFFRVALLGPDGRRLTDYDYATLRYEAPDRLVFSLPNQSSGVMDASGRVLMPAQYADARYTGCGWLVLELPEGGANPASSYPIAFIDGEGVRHDTGLHAATGWLDAYADGIICVSGGIDEYDGKGVYLDDHGRVLFGRGFDDADTFLGGLAAVNEGGKRGLIDRTGQFVVAPEFEIITRETTLRGPAYIANDGGRVCAFDASDGALLFELSFDADEVSAWAINPGMLDVTVGDDHFIYSMEGELLMSAPEGYDVDGYFSSGCTDVPGRLILQRGEWPFAVSCLVDLDGDQAGGEFQGLNGLTWQDGRGLYRTHRYRVYRDADGDYGADWRSWRYGVCDQDGRVLLDSVYSSIDMLSSDRFWVVDNTRTGMIDLDGNWYYTIDSYAELMD